MRTREKVIVLLIGATLVLGALIFLAFRDNEVEANYFRWAFANKLSYGFSSPFRFLSENLPAGSIIYGVLAIFAVIMTVVFLKMVRDGEIQALRRMLSEMRSEKHSAESLLQEQVWKGKTQEQAKALATRDLESSIEKIERLLEDLTDKERELKSRDTELMSLKASVLAGTDPAFSRTPAERLLREELEKKSDALQAKDVALKDLEQRFNARSRAWDSQLRNKDGLLKEQQNELESSRSEIADLSSRLQQLESAKKRTDEVLEEELRQKKEVLEANALALKNEQQRFGERVRSLESQLGERDKALRQRDTDLGGLRRQLSELESVRERAERNFQEELAKAAQDRQEKDRQIRDVEQRLGANLHALQNALSEKDLLVHVRDDELKGLKSEIKVLTQRLGEMGDAKTRAEETLQQSLRKEQQLFAAEKIADQERAERSDNQIKLLTSQVAEREIFLKKRDGEIQALEQELHNVTQRLAESAAAKEQSERLLREELKKEQGRRESEEAASRELEQRYSREVQSLTSQLGKEAESGKSREQEIKSLKTQVASLAEQLSKVGSAKERAASLLQQTLKKEKQVLQAGDSAVREIEKSFQAKISELEEQLAANRNLVGSRDGELTAVKSELTSLQQRMADLAAAKERAENLFEEAVKDRTDRLQTKETGFKKLEDDLTGKIWDLESRLRENEERLHSRESELNAIKDQLADVTSSKEQAAHALQQDLRQKTQQLSEKEAAIQSLEERFNVKLQSLEGELTEKQGLLEARDAEFKSLLDKINNQAGQLFDLETAKDQAARHVEAELQRTTELLQSRETALKTLDERLTLKVESLESQLGQKQELLETRDSELHALMGKVGELTQKLGEVSAERERSDLLLQEELREKSVLLQSKDSSIGELEERLTARIEALERQVAEKQKLLEASGAEMSEMRSQMNEMIEQLEEAESNKVGLESLLDQERNRPEKSLMVIRSNGDEELDGNGRGLDTLLSEREELLKKRDNLIQNLMTELKEKKTQLAQQEIQVWKDIERREAWKHRLAKIGIRLKD
jgi:chromosome segregation ATPase